MFAEKPSGDEQKIRVVSKKSRGDVAKRCRKVSKISLKTRRIVGKAKNICAKMVKNDESIPVDRRKIMMFNILARANIIL